MADISPLQKARAAYRPKLPPVFAGSGPFVQASEGPRTRPVADVEAIQAMFPHSCGKPVVAFEAGVRDGRGPLKVGVVLSGGQAPGGHNVIAGVFDALRAMNPGSTLYGFLGGPSGLTDNKYKLLDDATIDAYRNTGGFDIIGSGRTKLETEEQFVQVAANCEALGIGALIIIGGDDSNTNACLLAEFLQRQGRPITVVGCPKTIDGDLKNERIAASFGFDTATKVYSELIGNIERDANSAKKYWHFIKLMGRSASHIALECALQTHPTVALISEEVSAEKQTLRQIVERIAGLVRERFARRKKFGVVLIPEGLVEFIPETKRLISELNELLAKKSDTGRHFDSLASMDDKLQFVNSRLTPASAQVLGSLPGTVRMQLLLDRDEHGNVPVSQIETEKLLIDLVGDRIKEWNSPYKDEADKDKRIPFNGQSHFFGYEGRCAAPSNFDADYSYSLGYTAACLAAAGKTGYMACVGNLARPAGEWTAGGIPLTMMMNMEMRKGKSHPVIRKALVRLDGAPFRAFAAQRDAWAMEDAFRFPGPIQYFGPAEVCDATTLTLKLEAGQ
ncbi:MAG: 6-phosphofructokinase [Lentisphaerae bacterium ADurb.BinA184]|nr:MAG: 6-phosphofructokinase [Lentisphaerae bacterium ADurb.BinA184]